MKKCELLDKMLVLSTTAHSGQFDKAGKPYILHPLRVMHYLGTDDEELMCIALGHDLIEDTGLTYKDLLDAGMTDRIVKGILALTKELGMTYDEYKAKVFGSRDAMMVKKADLKDNTDLSRLKGITPKDLDRTTKYLVFYYEIEEKLKCAVV